MLGVAIAGAQSGESSAPRHSPPPSLLARLDAGSLHVLGESATTTYFLASQAPGGSLGSDTSLTCLVAASEESAGLACDPATRVASRGIWISSDLGPSAIEVGAFLPVGMRSAQQGSSTLSVSANGFMAVATQPGAPDIVFTGSAGTSTVPVSNADQKPGPVVQAASAPTP